jgi:hypothetical protein
MIKVLYDGWPLVYKPNSPASLHLLALLAHSPEEVQPVVALPGDEPPWFPAEVRTSIKFSPNTSGGRLKWEQSILPGFLREWDSDILHSSSFYSPLLARPATVLSPADWEERPGSENEAGFDPGQPPQAKGVWDRIRQAMGTGGMTHLSAVFWPEDLPLPRQEFWSGPVVPLPPIALPGFYRAELDPHHPEAPELPDTYILFHGPANLPVLRRILDSWSWVSGPLGEYYPLVLLGLSQAEQVQLTELLKDYKTGDTIQVLPEVSPYAIPIIYRKSKVIFHPAPVSIWGSPVRLALLSEQPLVACESPRTQAMVGEAAYLRPAGDPRTLGAALITLIVEENMSEKMSQAARDRSATWKLSTFRVRLLEGYQRALATK